MIVKCKKYLLLVGCLFYSVFRSSVQKQKNEIKTILVVQMAKLGDMVCTTPVFRSIKQKHPEVRLIVLGNKVNKAVIDGNSDIDEYVVFEGFFRTLRLLKNLRIDAVALLAPDFITLSLVYLSNIPFIVTPVVTNGFCPWQTWEYNILKNFVVTREHRMGTYAPREYLRLLEPLGIESDSTKKYVSFSAQAEQKVEQYLVEQNINQKKDFIVGVSPSAGNKIKNWGGNKFAEFADYIYGKYKVIIVIIGSLRDREEVEEMISYLNEETVVYNTLEKFNIDELKALISKMDLFVSVDTGPIYIAEALVVPTIDIVGPMDENEQPPRGILHRVVVAPGRKSPAIHIMNARIYDTEEARRHTDEISVSMVCDVFDDLYKSIHETGN